MMDEITDIVKTDDAYFAVIDVSALIQKLLQDAPVTELLRNEMNQLAQDMGWSTIVKIPMSCDVTDSFIITEISQYRKPRGEDESQEDFEKRLDYYSNRLKELYARVGIQFPSRTTNTFRVSKDGDEMAYDIVSIKTVRNIIEIGDPISHYMITLDVKELVKHLMNDFYCRVDDATRQTMLEAYDCPGLMSAAAPPGAFIEQHVTNPSVKPVSFEGRLPDRLGNP